MRDYPTVTVTTAPTLLARSTNEMVMLQNDGPVTVYVGGNAVTAARGQSMPVDSFMTFNDNKGDIYGCTASGTATVRVAGQVA